MPEFQAGPGLLLVFAELGEKVTEEQFHDWYDNEHIPLRTSSLPEFNTAARYVAHDNKEPKWAAMYSISDNTLFGEDRYTKLRANRSEREGKLVASLGVLDRRIYKLSSSSPSTPSSQSEQSEPSPTSPHPKLVIFHALTPTTSSDSTSTTTSTSSSSELSALLTSAENRYSALPGFIRVRKFDSVDIVRSGLRVRAEGSEGEDVGSVLEVVEFSDPSILTSDPFTSLSSWYTDALDPLCSYRSFRAFGLWKEYEATAALQAQKK
ncbi:hypothetical protein FFLO_03147 [Filobasidium floriforme]|uniref:EthD domain-containing protein n=1 Tax=Filobasidium floriforme TaxID=5210 RepID=A0A8K0JLA1_9TREE|nr:uncharacterized protein HD553DRAFT_307677 [Filobasidium floriforme]KAG7548942.1 hypothetical protein FFLO_03147 [Filobasidium floriforme]KAH8088240.1 hypothetical protein HD553DRAFT_307677 [Filobasidium floriforme]